MTNARARHRIDEQQLLRDFSSLVGEDRRDTATLLAYLAEIDRRRLYLEHAYPSMFALPPKPIRAGRAADRFPCIFGMFASGERHLRDDHVLARQHWGAKEAPQRRLDLQRLVDALPEPLVGGVCVEARVPP